MDIFEVFRPMDIFEILITLDTIQSQEINGTCKLQSTPPRVWPMVYSVFIFSSFDGGSRI